MARLFTVAWVIDFINSGFKYYFTFDLKIDSPSFLSIPSRRVPVGVERERRPSAKHHDDMQGHISFASSTF